MTRVFLDTNVLVYAYDDYLPQKQRRAREVIEQLAAAARAIVSTQVLQEFYWVVTRRLTKPVPEEVAEQAVKSLLTLPVLQVTPALVLDAIRRSRSEQLALWDALIIEAALAGGASSLYSEDMQSGRRVGDLTIENPFEGT
jgi:predicted nucleic acid-binding protein